MKRFTSTVVISLLVCSSLVAISNVKTVRASNIIRIRDDGSVEGTDKIQRNGNVYTLTDDIYASVNGGEAFIFIETHNIVIDGAGHTIQGTGTGNAILMLRRQGVTIKNVNINGFANGIYFWSVMNCPADSKYWGLPPASNNKILDNNITVTIPEFVLLPGSHGQASWAIFLQEVYGTLISGNILTSEDPQGGIFFGFETGGTSLLNNTFVGCSLHITSSEERTGFGNTVDGKPLVFLNGESNQIIDDAGLVYLFNCDNMTIKDVQSSIDYGKTVQLTGTRNTKITNCEGYITLTNSNYNSIYGNNPTVISLSESSHNSIYSNIVVTSGVCVRLIGQSNHNRIYENILLNDNSTESAVLSYTGRTAVGINLADGCRYNDMYGNNILNQSVAFECSGSSLNNFYSNNIVNSEFAITFSSSDQNNVYQNNIENCGYAIKLVGSDNVFYHNNFVENEQQVTISHQTLFSSSIITAFSTNNTFDSGYPSGGNYWSDYNGTDADGDGIGDTPYIVYENNTDRYPLMNPVALQITPPSLDTTPPSISVISPQNTTYTTNSITFQFKLDEETSWMGYNLDGQNNITLTENTITLTELTDGSHNLTVYANDTAGNMGASEKIHFTIQAIQTAWIITAIVIAVVVVAAASSLTYFIKTRKTPQNKAAY